MKTIYFCILILINIYSASAQTQLKPAPLSTLSYLGNTLSLEDTSIWAPRIQKHFMLGWQWQGPSEKTNKRLHCNFFHDHFGYPDTRSARMGLIPDSGNVKYVVWQFLQQRDTNIAVWAMGDQLGFQFDPTGLTKLDLHNPIRQGDTTGAVYGFKQRDTVYGYLDTLNAPNFDRYSLKTTGFLLGSRDTGIVVLSQPVIDDRFYQFHSEYTDTNTSRRIGRWWYLSLNLRRTNSTDTIMNDDTLISISIPSIRKNSTNFNIRFEKIPVDNVGYATSLPHGRGIVLPLGTIPLGADSTRLVITRKMLPIGTATDRDITISAFFKVSSDVFSSLPNPELVYDNELVSTPTGRIRKLGIDVRYHGRGNVSIDWLRIGTPQLENELRGELDSNIWAHTDTTLRIIKSYIDNGRNFRLLSFYGKDETPPEQYLSMRYYSALMDGRFTTEGPAEALQRIAMNYHNVWSGGMGGLKHPSVPTPILRFGGRSAIPHPEDKYYFRLKTGYDFRKYTMSYWSPDGSSYETRLEDKPIKRSDSSASNYFKKTNIDTIFNSNVANPGSLGSYEHFAYYCYLESPFYYSGKPWWVNNWGTFGMVYLYAATEVNRNLSIEFIKPMTGEEMRLQIWTPLIHGAKGLMYDRMYSDVLKLNRTIKSIDTTVTPRDTIYSCDTCSGDYGIQKNNFQTGMMYASGDIPDSLEGTDLINSDAAGSDFLRTGDSTHLDLLQDLDRTADSMGVPRGRVYMGRKSMRREVMKAHDFISVNDSLLMSMRLVSWFGKGFYFYQTGDTSLFSRYIVSDPDKFKVRPPTRTYYDSTAAKTLPYYEDPDSTFFDLTIHKVGTTPLDSSFILCALNRRTAPFLMEHDSVSGKDTILRFVTTAEFDSIVAGNPSKKYAQSGAREITIPFNYNDTLGRYAMLHVKELGGGIDTIIGQDSPLAVKFLPGEGKMFSVSILHPDPNVAGRLHYSNQRKMVGYPIPRPDGTPSDSVYYHLTYHRYDSIAARNSVYYRRSNPVWYNSSSENVTWQSEKTLSQFIRASKCDGDTIMRLDCAYPSLIVRYDSADSMNKVYVVYSCVAPFIADSCNPSGKQLIAENVLKADADDSTYIADTAQVFNTYRGIMSEYGNPMVNASARGNYYCWSDSTVGIVIGWKPPYARALTDSKPLSWGAANGGQTLGCKHPSMNSYSRISLEEADCALVWQEDINMAVPYIGTIPRTHIFYTRLRMVGDTTIDDFLSPAFFSTGESVSKSSDGKIARMSSGAWASNVHRLPSVYRDLVDSVVSGSSTLEQRDARTDCLIWSVQEYATVMITPPIYTIVNNYDAVYRRTAWINDSATIPTVWGVGGLCQIWEYGSFLENPSISQGISKIYNTGSYSINESDSALIMSINEYTTTLDGTTNKLWHIRGNVNYLYAEQDTTVYGYYNDGLANVVTTNGEYGQTAAFPVVGGASAWRKNRRIYQADTASPHVQMSPQYFLKASDKDEQIGFTGFSNEESKYMLSNPMLSGKALKFNRVRHDQLSNEKRVRYYDRISTGWFTVGDTESLWLKSIGKNAGLVMAFVERRNDGARFPVQLGTSDDTTALWTQINLRRGGTEEYRFFILKRLTNENNRAITESGYGEEMVLHGIKTTLRSQKMGANGIQEIDLGRDVNVGASIRVYPNPAHEKVTVVVTDTNQKNTWHVKVLNVLGTILSEHDSKPNTSIEIVTEDYPTGIYYIIAESEKLTTRARFVIMR
jgi:hypothetical protein